MNEYKYKTVGVNASNPEKALKKVKKKMGKLMIQGWEPAGEQKPATKVMDNLYYAFRHMKKKENSL